MAVKYDKDDKFEDIVCDKCGKSSPPTADLILNHGLTGMGWKCSGGTHVCAGCVELGVQQS